MILQALRRYPLPALLVLALLLGLAFQGTRGLWEPDEGRYTNVALQMLGTGDFISLRRNSEALHFTKPPLTYWAIAASVGVLGRNEWAVRLPMALAFALTVGLVFGLGKRFVPERPWLPALIYATSPVPFLAANTVNTDTVLTAMETLAMFCYVQARFGDGRRAWIDAMWAVFGLAFLTKGPPALLPLAAIVVFHWLHRGRYRLLRPAGFLAFAAIGFGWFAIVIQRHPGLLDYFLGHELYARVATDKLQRFPQWYGPFLVYVPTLLLGSLPWLALCLGKLRIRPWNAMPEPLRLLCLWFGLPLLIFSLSRSRLPLYVLPLFVPLSLLLARALSAWRWNRIGQALLGLWLLVLLAGKAATAYWSSDKDSRAFAAHLQPMLPGAPSEFLFVEDMTRNGLTLYFDAEVKRLSFKPMPRAISDSAYDDTLAEALSGGETGRIFVMKREVEGYFLAALREAGKQPLPLGAIPDRQHRRKRERVVYSLVGDFPE
jgi:4-amino-4-deoxy-L-arabinose transferase-like glycosyltransferase